MATQPIPSYEFWQASDADAAFGADIDKYVNRSEASSIERALPVTAKVCAALFYGGGTLREHGLQWKPEIATQRPMRTLQALLGSFAPPHEAKVATVALALHHWCDPIADDAKATGK
jgi:hypothetical protein